jgi:hypothetical protein
MEQLLQEMKPDAVKLYQQNTKAYAVQLRAKAQAMKVLAQQMREEALAHHRNIAGRGKNKTVGGAPISGAGSTQNQEDQEDQIEDQEQLPEPVQQASVPVVPQVPVQTKAQTRKPRKAAGQ